ncbi:MAG TPA: HEAT repeat domain-containing protein [Polyangia bacterium]|nr:HEAT repeat domain-containing protein [Polyangia bacterium]
MTEARAPATIGRVPVLVHLIPEKLASRALRGGLRAARFADGEPRRGLYCMPVLGDYQVSHQWLRELKRRGQRAFVGVDFRVPDGEPVWVGHYGRAHVRTTVGEAIGVILRQPDARGYQLVLPRSVEPREILRVRAVSRVVGWRYFPGAHGRPPCRCDYCQRGTINAARDREPAPPRPKRGELLAALAVERDEAKLIALIDELARARPPEAAVLRRLAAHPSPDVVEALVWALAGYRTLKARALLGELAQHPDRAVRERAASFLDEEDL